MLGIRYEWVCIYRVSVKKTRFHVNCYKWRDIFSFTETGKIQSVQRQKKYFKHLDCNHSFQILRIFLLILWMRILRPENKSSTYHVYCTLILIFLNILVMFCNAFLYAFLYLYQSVSIRILIMYLINYFSLVMLEFNLISK